MALALYDPPLYVGTAPRRRPRAVYVRRRCVVLLLLALVVVACWSAAGRAVAALGDVPASVPEGAPSRPELVGRVVVVEAGDTLWSIARDLQPEGDVRPLVRVLAAANGGPDVHAGTRLLLP